MKTFLIILVLLSYLGGIGAVVGVSKARGTVPNDLVLVLCIVAVCNVACALYLHRKAAYLKIEWALFGAIGNINALLFFWVFGSKQQKSKH